MNIKALGFSIAVLWGGCLLLVGLLNFIWPAYGRVFLEGVASVYPGYEPIPSVREVIVVTLYGLVDGFIGGVILAWLYNLFLPATTD